MFLIRAAFWLSIVILFLPGDPKSGTESPGLSAIDALIAARGAVADLSGMCERQPAVCSNGSAALQSFGAKARYGAQFLYKTVSGQPTADDPIGAEIDKMSADGGTTASGTLTPNDVAPQWHASRAAGRKV